MNNNLKKGVNYKAEALSIRNKFYKASINYSRERSCVVVSIVAYQDDKDRCRPHNRINWIFTHVGLSAHAHNNYCARG